MTTPEPHLRNAFREYTGRDWDEPDEPPYPKESFAAGFRAALQPSPSPVVVEPTAAKALEFAEYLAKRAEQLLDALNAEDEAHVALNESDADEPDYEALDARHCRAIEGRCELVRGVRSSVYEFRKRRDRLNPKRPEE